MSRHKQNLLIFLLGWALALLSIREINGDYYWLLAAGKQLSNNGLTQVDPFRTLNWGEEWINQQWLFEILLYQAKQLIGEQGLLLLYTACLSGIATICWAMVKNTKLRVAAYLLTLLSLTAILDLRAAGAGMLCFAAMVYLLRSNKLWSRPVIILLFIPWANLHGSFIAGLTMLLLCAVGQSLEERKPSRLFITLAGAGAATLITPYGIKTYQYVIGLSSNSALPHLTSEWRPGFERPAVLGLTILFLAVIAYAYRKQTKPIPFQAILVTLGFAAMTLIASRNAVFLGPVAAYLLAPLGKEPDKEYKPAAVLIGGAAALLIGIALFAPKPQISYDLCAPLINKLPASLPSRLYLSSGQGSYLLYRRPDLKSSVDGRLENYSAKQLMETRQITNAWPHAYNTIGRYQARTIIARTAIAKRRLQSWGFKPIDQAGRCMLLNKSS